MQITGQELGEQGAREFAQKVAVSYVMAAASALIGSMAALVYAVRWW